MTSVWMCLVLVSSSVAAPKEAHNEMNKAAGDIVQNAALKKLSWKDAFDQLESMAKNGNPYAAIHAVDIVVGGLITAPDADKAWKRDVAKAQELLERIKDLKKTHGELVWDRPDQELYVGIAGQMPFDWARMEIEGMKNRRFQSMDKAVTDAILEEVKGMKLGWKVAVAKLETQAVILTWSRLELARVFLEGREGVPANLERAEKELAAVKQKEGKGSLLNTQLMEERVRLEERLLLLKAVGLEKGKELLQKMDEQRAKKQ